MAPSTDTHVRGAFIRGPNHFTDRITAAGEAATGGWAVEPGRYQLVVSLACPWADLARPVDAVERVPPAWSA